MLLRSILAALVLAAPVWAVEPKAVVSQPTQVEPGDITVLDGSASTGDAFAWIALSGKPAIPSESGKSAYFASGKPGDYRFLLVVAGTSDGKAKIDTATVTIRVVGAPPAPSPNPTPDPTPGPTPAPTPKVVGHIYATYIADAANILPSHAALKAAPKIRDGFKSLDATWRWYQSDESEPKTYRLLEHVERFPSVVIQGNDGKVLAVLAGPSEDDILAKVRELRGAK